MKSFRDENLETFVNPLRSCVYVLYDDLHQSVIGRPTLVWKANAIRLFAIALLRVEWPCHEAKSFISSDAETFVKFGCQENLKII